MLCHEGFFACTDNCSAVLTGDCTSFCGDGILQPEQGERCEPDTPCAWYGYSSGNVPAQITRVLEDAGTALSSSRLSTGDSFTCALEISGAISCWGSNLSGQCGRSHPEQLELPARIFRP